MFITISSIVKPQNPAFIVDIKTIFFFVLITSHFPIFYRNVLSGHPNFGRYEFSLEYLCRTKRLESLGGDTAGGIGFFQTINVQVFFVRRWPRQVFAVSEWRRVYSLLLLYTDTQARMSTGKKGQRLGSKINKIYVLDGVRLREQMCNTPNPVFLPPHRFSFARTRKSIDLCFSHQSKTIYNGRLGRSRRLRPKNISIDVYGRLTKRLRLSFKRPKRIIRVLYDTFRTV